MGTALRLATEISNPSDLNAICNFSSGIFNCNDILHRGLRGIIPEKSNEERKGREEWWW
jgi:hypothetical protein